jgi:cytochrome c5
MLKKRLAALACLPAFAGCAQPEPPPAPAEVAVPSAPAGSVDRAQAGLAAYRRVCAGCHEEGKRGAPVAGRAEQWASRSDLWQAVLSEHVKQGYLGMPAKGGEPTLSDREVQAAAEYMLSLTHPQVPTD